MEKTGFYPLVYRKLVLSKKRFISSGVIFLIIAVFGILFKLSFVYGNLAKLDPEIIFAIYDTTTGIIDLLPPAMAGMIATAAAESSMKDCGVLWKRFRMSTPIKPIKWALAETSVFAGSLAVQMAAGTLYLLITRSIDGAGLSVTDAAMLLMIETFLTLFAVLFQILTLLFGKAEVAGIVLLAALMAVLAPYVMFGDHEQTASDDNIVSLFGKWGETLLPFMPFMIVGMFAAQTALLTLIFKRREK